MDPKILSAIRSVLIAIGGMLAAKGFIDDATVETIIGALLTLGSAAWGVYAKLPKSPEAQAVAQAVVDHPDVPNPKGPSGQEVK